MNFIAYADTTSILIDSSNKLYDTVIVSPAYVMRTPTHAFTRENNYTKKETIYKLTTTVTSSEFRATELIAHVKGDLGIHYIELLAPLKYDISSLANGSYSVCIYIEYVKNQGTKVNVNIASGACANGTLIGTLVKGGTTTFTKNTLDPETGGETLKLYTGTAAALPILPTSSGETPHIQTY